jgi:hypothetical protein
MFNALVTTVMAGSVASRCCRSVRAASLRAVAVVVVPPLNPTTVPGSSGDAALAVELGPVGVDAAAVARRQVVGHPGGDHAAVGAGGQLPVGQGREVAADRRLGDGERHRRLGHRQPAAVAEQRQQRAPALRAVPAVGRHRHRNATVT